MSTAVAKILKGQELVLAGQQAKAHIDAAQRHEGKAEDQYKSAGSYLTDAKRSVRHGQWLPWLGKFGISSQTASRCMLIYESPERYEQERLTDVMRAARTRQESRSYRANSPDTGIIEPREVYSRMRSSPEREEEGEKEYARRVQSQPPATERPQLSVRCRLNDVLARLSDEQLKQVLQFATKLMEKTK